MKKKALGRGLDALLGEGSNPDRGESRTVLVEVSRVVPNRRQPRRHFPEERMEELVESIRTHGILQPILVRPLRDGGFEVIAGERRLRAARILGLDRIPARVLEASDEAALELALIENLQREDLNPMEAAEGYHRLMAEFGLTHEEIAHRIGKDRTTVTNTLRLLALPKEVQQDVAEGRLSLGHAKALLGLERVEDQVTVAREVIQKGLSVRQTEQWVRQWKRGARPREKAPPAPEIRSLEERLQRVLGTRVRLRPGRKGGRIVVEYYDHEDLERILEVLGA